MSNLENADVVGRELIHQVQKAVPKGGSEQDVVTVISAPMWALWCTFINVPVNSEPTDWIGSTKTVRVYGSLTIVLPEDSRAFSFSFARGTDPGFGGKK